MDQAGVNTNGKLQAVELDIICDCGCNFNEATTFFAAVRSKNCYNAKAWKLRPYYVKTDTPSNTYCRAPGFKLSTNEKGKLKL